MSSQRPHADVPGMKLPTPRTPDPASAPALRWGLLGAGWIASQMAFSLQGTSQQVVAVGSRDADRAERFVAEHAPGARPHGDYASLVADPEVDVVYVASPHSEHLEHALLAIAAGKHVLVEKPMAPTAGEAEAAVRDLPRWHDDPQGDPGWRRHVAGIASLAVVAELTHPTYREAPC